MAQTKSMLNHSIQTNSQANSQTVSSAAVFGATGAIGHEFCLQLLQHGCKKLYRFYRTPSNLVSSSDLKIHNESNSASQDIEIVDIQFDISDATSILQATQLIQDSVDLVVVATGWLHNDNSSQNDHQGDHFMPEKSFKELDVEQLTKSWQINFLGPSLIFKNLLAKNPLRKTTTTFAVLSARVGSISDNRMGGWYSYRCAKAALNMMVKNLSIELKRARSDCKIVALQPGTTDSALSKPFQKYLKPGQLQSAETSVKGLLQVIQNLSSEQSGCLMDFEGNVIEP